MLCGRLDHPVVCGAVRDEGNSGNAGDVVGQGLKHDTSGRFVYYTNEHIAQNSHRLPSVNRIGMTAVHPFVGGRLLKG